ncbi:MAG: (Fe-S)-binding protein [Coriobacteriia bacterium]|nr:(Fe-S)-binding protein [Coriobacteriia bacterium]
MDFNSVLKVIEDAAYRCTECGICTHRCVVLDTEIPLTIGQICKHVMWRDPDDPSTSFLSEGKLNAPEEEFFEHVRKVLHTTRPDILFAIRRCCMCGFCTIYCPVDIDARAAYTALRALMYEADVINKRDFRLTKIDEPWHLFSAYRAINGISYLDMPRLLTAEEREEQEAQDGESKENTKPEYLFFPGCTLASYAPELTREVFDWLNEHGYPSIITEDCCGSPLKSAGNYRDLTTFKDSLRDRMISQGIKKIVFVCPGCEEELKEAIHSDDEFELIPLPRLLVEQGVTISSDQVAQSLKASPDQEDKNQAAQVCVFDSCHDRDQRYGACIRELFKENEIKEMRYRGKNAQCCWASGSTSLVDPDIGPKRAQELFDEGLTVANLQVNNCPTCAYTMASHALSHPELQDVAEKSVNGLGFSQLNYLELVFENKFDWDKVFEQLQGMWTGEYGAWAAQELL